MLRRVDMDMDMDILIPVAIDKLRCPCQTVLAKSLDAARRCKCCFIMNGTSGGRLAGWVGHGEHSLRGQSMPAISMCA